MLEYNGNPPVAPVASNPDRRRKVLDEMRHARERQLLADDRAAAFDMTPAAPETCAFSPDVHNLLDASAARRAAKKVPVGISVIEGEKSPAPASTARTAPLGPARLRRFRWLDAHGAGMTVYQLRVAMRLIATCGAGYGGSVADLAAALGIDRASASRALDALCAAGLLTKTRRTRRDGTAPRCAFYAFRVR